MKTRNEILKMRAVVLYVLQTFQEGVDYIKLFKILYFAQKEHLVKYGRGVIDDTFHALQYGPVPSFIYKSFQMLEGRLEMEPDFEEFCKGIRVADKSKVISTENSDLDELSISDVKCLDKSIRRIWSLIVFPVVRMMLLGGKLLVGRRRIRRKIE